ncbi:MAG: hypothetical protein JSV26_05465 [bacterium]|nr:MAG: hypothetical protein JSV26_05465 [bacterium]
MKKLFLYQSTAVFVLLYIQMAVQEGDLNVLLLTIQNFSVILALSILVSVFVTGIRRLFSRTLDVKDAVLRTSVYVLPIYYVMQLLGWLINQDIIDPGT